MSITSRKTKPSHIEYVEAAGGEVRFYKEANGTWRYVCAYGEGCGHLGLKSAIDEIKKMVPQVRAAQ